MGVTEEPLWREPRMAAQPNPGKLIASRAPWAEAQRIARRAGREGRSLEVWAVRPAWVERVYHGAPDRQYDIYEVEHGGIQWLEPPNFYEWPWGGYTEHQGTPWSP